MLRHAIAPSGRYTKASHDVVRNRRLNSDAKIILLYVQGLPEDARELALYEHAAKLGIKGRAFQKAKASLIEAGHFHDFKGPNALGQWCTEQLLSNVVLTRIEAVRIREAHGRGDGQEPPVSPSARKPTVGRLRGRRVGDSLPKDEEQQEEERFTHPPTEAPTDEPERDPEPERESESEPESEPEREWESRPESEPRYPKYPAPVLAEAEKVLLSLRHTRRELHLGVREARELAELAAEWLLRDITPRELGRVLTENLPFTGVRSAAGFVRHRLVHKLPDLSPFGAAASRRAAAAAETGETAETAERPQTAVRGLITCAGPGDEHVFRPVGDEARCGPCRADHAASPECPEPPPVASAYAVPWRERVSSAAVPT